MRLLHLIQEDHGVRAQGELPRQLTWSVTAV
jgi:hypothetical protein